MYWNEKNWSGVSKIMLKLEKPFSIRKNHFPNPCGYIRGESFHHIERKKFMAGSAIRRSAPPPPIESRGEIRYNSRMINLEEEQARRPTALLVGAPGVDLRELRGLVDTLGMEAVRLESLARLEPSPAYGMGSGKAEELSALAEEVGADVIIFDFLLEPRKQRNWEKLAKRPVFDRQEVILRIFAQRARTKEAVLQVQLARLEYSLPRLAHSYGDMARQRGGNFGSKGSGETQLELDSREVREKMAAVRRELEAVVGERRTQRKRRERSGVPSVALAGYTNAGKSSLLNALTGADALVEDKLFATLDPTTRKLQLDGGATVLLTDTVGFISNLPHQLVNAFKSTLEEAARADLLLVVLDASDPQSLVQHETVERVLSEVGAGDTPRIVVLNKTDKVPRGDFMLARLESEFPGAVKVSARTRGGFDELLGRIGAELLGEEADFVLPAGSAEAAAVLAEARRNGAVVSEEWLDDGVHARIRADSRLRALLQKAEAVEC